MWVLVCVHEAGFCAGLVSAHLSLWPQYSVSGHCLIFDAVLHVMILVVGVSVCLHSYCESLCQACIWPCVWLLCVWIPVCVSSLNSCTQFEWAMGPSIHSGHLLTLPTVGVDTELNSQFTGELSPWGFLRTNSGWFQGLGSGDQESRSCNFEWLWDVSCLGIWFVLCEVELLTSVPLLSRLLSRLKAWPNAW